MLSKHSVKAFVFSIVILALAAEIYYFVARPLSGVILGTFTSIISPVFAAFVVGIYLVAFCLLLKIWLNFYREGHL
jgi:hypothetical protein